MVFRNNGGYANLPSLDANGNTRSQSRSRNGRSRGPSPVPPYDPASSYDRPYSPGHFSAAGSNVSQSAQSFQPPYAASNAPSPMYNSFGPGSPSPAYSTLPPAPSSVVSPAVSAVGTPMSSRPPRLPHFEAALARARGEVPPLNHMQNPARMTTPAHMPTPPPHLPTPPVHTPIHMATPPRHMATPPVPPRRAAAVPQPLPSYLPPPDPNHPDLAVGFTQSSTVRYAMGYGRERSRSPSPGFDDSVNYDRVADVEKALMAEQEGAQLHQPPVGSQLTQRPPYSADLNGDISLMGGGFTSNDSRDSLYKSPVDDDFETVPLVEGQEGKDTQHFGPAPTQRIGRRGANARRVKQKVTLDDTGMFAVEMPIPTRLATHLPVNCVAEQRSTRYTAVTTDPNDFPASGVLLRQNRYNPPRQTEMFIVITMYNEDAVLFCRTLYGVMKNIAHLCHRKNSRTWGAKAWQKVVVCIVADGRKIVNPRVLDCLAALGVYQEGAMTSKVKERPVTAHVFEYTTSFALDPDLQFKYPDKGTIVPCQIIFCMKEKNAKKINSHRWFFNAFAPLLQPNVCILLDVGTMPGTKSIYHLWKAFDLNSNVGGACGEIATFKGKAWKLLLNPLVAAQCFEYKMSNILDKPMESLFGYCAVLPGAFSAYRYIALLNDQKGQGPLASYFKGENLHGSGASTFSQNMYLAEDRVLCFEIVAKPNANWVLKYVKSAIGETDCPDTFPEFIGQRRRWLNGSFFAALYAMIHVRRIWQSGHSFWRRTALMVEFFYNALNLVFGWFAMGNFYIFFVILTNALAGPEFNLKGINVFNTILQYLYIAALVACFIFGLGNRPQGSPWKYRVVIYFFGVLTFYMLCCGVVCVVQAVKNTSSPIFGRMVVSLIATYGIFIVSSILALDPWHMFTCFLQYLLFTPTYTNVLQIYAYSNLHDLSWGTKGSDTVEDELGAVRGVGNSVEVAIVSEQVDIDSAYQDALDNLRIKRDKVDEHEVPKRADSGEQKQKDAYANFRTDLLLLWTLSNALLASVILAGVDASNTFTGSGTRTTVYMLVILVFVAAMSAFRFICATLYLIIRLFTGV